MKGEGLRTFFSYFMILNGISSSVPTTALGVLEVDISKLIENYRYLQSQASEAFCGAAVKADAYGLGQNTVSYYLALAGCDHFFVVQVDEGIRLREYLRTALPHKNPKIYVMVGVMPGTEDLLIHYGLIPTLLAPYQLMLWKKAAFRHEKILSAVLHFDTGMARTGFMPDQAIDLANSPGDLEGISPQIIMSHLTCSNELDNPTNQKQLQLFNQLCSSFPGISQSLSNSWGIFLGKDFHKNLVRPGGGIYGLSLAQGVTNEIPGIKSLISIKAKIVQIHSIRQGQAVGYSGTFIADRSTRIATLGVGYADGYVRGLSNKGVVKIKDWIVPVIGRVSMDFVTVDITDIPENQVREGEWALLMGDELRLNNVASTADTISYELTVNISQRYHRRYIMSNVEEV
jgi:alanine racemase